jgi:hypothetical protein
VRAAESRHPSAWTKPGGVAHWSEKSGQSMKGINADASFVRCHLRPLVYDVYDAVPQIFCTVIASP